VAKYRMIEKELAILPDGQPMYGETVTTVGLDDEGGGPFVVVKQLLNLEENTVQITAEEWPLIRKAAERMLKTCERLEQ